VRNISLNHLSYAAILLNLWILFVGLQAADRGLQLLAIFNMILLTLGLLLKPPERKDK
jgi:hypothetical protein